MPSKGIHGSGDPMMTFGQFILDLIPKLPDHLRCIFIEMQQKYPGIMSKTGKKSQCRELLHLILDGAEAIMYSKNV